MAALSTQVHPELQMARLIAVMDSSSSTSPQPNRQGPPIAQAPNPTTSRSGPV